MRPCLLIAIAGSAVLLAPLSEAADKDGILHNTAESSTRFAIELYHQLIDGKPKANIAFSPLSTYSCLAMVGIGTRGESCMELSKALHLPIAGDRMDATALSAVGRQLDGNVNGSKVLSSANSLWLDTLFSVLPAFETEMSRSFGAVPNRLDFQGDPEACGRIINAWSREKTRGLIPEILPAESLRRDTRLVLCNAAFFEMDWADPFHESVTKPSVFHGAEGDMTVQLMRKIDRMRYASISGTVDIVELPCKGGSHAMHIFLPLGEGGPVEKLHALERKLTAGELKGWQKQLHSRAIDLHLPRFSVSYSEELSDSLKSLGMTSVFNLGKADFSGINGKRDIFIDKVHHKTTVEVWEDGTRAAASTAVVVEIGCARPSAPLDIRVDRPFLFTIHEIQSGRILFLGRVMVPRSPTADDVMEKRVESRTRKIAAAGKSGIMIAFKNTLFYPTVVRVLPGGPAAVDGRIKPADRLVTIWPSAGSGEGLRTLGLRLREVGDLLLGENDSDVSVLVEHDDGSREKITLTRQRYFVPRPEDTNRELNP